MAGGKVAVSMAVQTVAVTEVLQTVAVAEVPQTAAVLEVLQAAVVAATLVPQAALGVRSLVPPPRPGGRAVGVRSLVPTPRSGSRALGGRALVPPPRSGGRARVPHLGPQLRGTGREWAQAASHTSKVDTLLCTGCLCRHGYDDKLSGHLLGSPIQ